MKKDNRNQQEDKPAGVTVFPATMHFDFHLCLALMVDSVPFASFHGYALIGCLTNYINHLKSNINQFPLLIARNISTPNPDLGNVSFSQLPSPCRRVYRIGTEGRGNLLGNFSPSPLPAAGRLTLSHQGRGNL